MRLSTIFSFSISWLLWKNWSVILSFIKNSSYSRLIASWFQNKIAKNKIGYWVFDRNSSFFLRLSIDNYQTNQTNKQLFFFSEFKESRIKNWSISIRPFTRSSIILIIIIRKRFFFVFSDYFWKFSSFSISTSVVSSVSWTKKIIVDISYFCFFVSFCFINVDYIIIKWNHYFNSIVSQTKINLISFFC